MGSNIERLDQNTEASRRRGTATSTPPSTARSPEHRTTMQRTWLEQHVATSALVVKRTDYFVSLSSILHRHTHWKYCIAFTRCFWCIGSRIPSPAFSSRPVRGVERRKHALKRRLIVLGILEKGTSLLSNERVPGWRLGRVVQTALSYCTRTCAVVRYSQRRIRHIVTRTSANHTTTSLVLSSPATRVILLSMRTYNLTSPTSPT